MPASKPTHVATHFLLLFLGMNLGGASPARAQEVSFDQAIEASAVLPAVKAIGAELTSRTRLDRSLPGNRGALELSLTPGLRLSPDSDKGPEIGVGVAQSWNLAGLSAHTKGAAKAERDVLAARLRAKALATRIEAAQRWFALHQAEQALALVTEERGVIADIDEANQKARAAGLATATAEAEAAAAHAEAKRLYVDLEGMRAEAALALALATGRAPSLTLKTSGTLPQPLLPSAVEIASLSLKIDQLPQVELRRLQSVAVLARAAESRASIGTRAAFGVEAQRESTGSNLLMGTFRVSFAGANKGQRAHSMAKAESLRRLQEAQALVQALQAEVAQAVHELEHSEENWAVVHKEVLPATQTLLSQRQRELELGEGTTLEVLRARARLLQAKRYGAHAETARRQAQVHLWLLMAEIQFAETKETP